MGFFSNLFGFRWSLYIVRNGKQGVYAMHEHSVIRMLGYVMRYFADGGKPGDSWSLHLSYNRTHQTIKLIPEHFTSNGDSITPLLIKQIESLDPNWKVKGGEPVFEECSTKKRLRITPDKIDIQERLANINKPRELTFFRVMNEVFGKGRQPSNK